MNHLVTLALACALIVPGHAVAADPANLAHGKPVKASSILEDRYAPSKAVDGVVSDDSRWISSRTDTNKWYEINLEEAQTLRQAHIYSGYQDEAALQRFHLEAWSNGGWVLVPGTRVSQNTQQSLRLQFSAPVKTERVRLIFMDEGPVRLREIALFATASTLGTGVRTDLGFLGFPKDQHLVAVNQIGFATRQPKRFTAPQSPNGSRFEVFRVGESKALFTGTIQDGVGDLSAFQPADSDAQYFIAVSGSGLKSTESDRFLVRSNFHQEHFWQAAVDFMVDARSVVGTHPSAYGGCPWRDGTYYDFIVPSLVELVLADAVRVRAMPVQMDWHQDKARVLAPDFKFDAKNPHSEGVMDAVRRYYTELDPPVAGAPDVVQLIHWGLGYYLMNPATRDPSGDPLPRQIHSQTVEQFAFFLYAWPQLKSWIPESFYRRCRDFTFNHWKSSGLLQSDPLWHPKTYLTPDQMEGQNPTGGPLHPYKGRHAPGHSIMPNLLLYEVARREGRPDADMYLKAAVAQAEWIIQNLDWRDPRTTKGQRMSEHKTIPGLVWLLEHYPERAPAGLKQKITDWARVAVSRSENMWDFRRYDLEEHWTIPKLNEPGNLASFAASATAASWVVDEPALKQRLQVLAAAHVDNLFGRNPQLAACPNHPEKGFPEIERGWPKKFPENVCARLETTRGALCASPGTEMYPFHPSGRFRHSEGWVNFNAAWNVALAYLHWDQLGSQRRKSQHPNVEP